MKKNIISKENVLKNYAWKPGDGDYSVKKEVNENISSKMILAGYTKKLKSIIGKIKK